MAGFSWIVKGIPPPPTTSPSQQGKSANRSFVHSALMVEAIAIKTALHDAIIQGYISLVIWSDSKSLVSLLNSKGRCNAIQEILFDIHMLCIFFSSISFKFVPRLKNVEADTSAKSGMFVLRNSAVAEM